MAYLFFRRISLTLEASDLAFVPAMCGSTAGAQRYAYRLRFQ